MNADIDSRDEVLVKREAIVKSENDIAVRIIRETGDGRSKEEDRKEDNTQVSFLANFGC